MLYNKEDRVREVSMYKVAIVEDERATSDTFKKYIEDFAAEKNEKIEAEVFSDGMHFIAAYEPKYDIVLMDIVMPGINGIETAKKLREIDSAVIIMFITTMAQYAINGYEVNAIDFLLKPVNYFTFSLKLSKAMRLCDRRRDFGYAIKTSDGDVRVALSDIYYIESEKHYCVFHTCGGNYRMRMSMIEAEKEFAPKNFGRCSTSFLVNLAHIKSIKHDDVVLGGNKEIFVPISRTKRKTFLETFTVYIGGGKQ